MKPTQILLFILGLFVAFALIVYTTEHWMPEPEIRSFNLAKINEIPENLESPDDIYYLPDELTEISGLCYWESNRLLAIQDEDGILFSYDLMGKKVSGKASFGKNLDYEGITRRDSVIYVLEMDGDIRYFNYEDGAKKYSSSKLETPFNSNNDTEGICYDPVTQKMLIVPKGKQLGSGKQQKDISGIYALDLATQQLAEDPVYTIDHKRIGKIIGEEEAYKMKPSGIAVHPRSGNIYVIASVGKILVVINRNSEILRVELLDRSLLPQPEGITFSPEGDLFISSEGKSSTPKIVRYNNPGF